ncbi:MAG TPA: hypothetical protein VGM41_11370 [Chitinophagaceae bacterium]|jgi:hypothetical protein
MKQVLYVTLLSLALAACGTTAVIEKSWRDPSVTVDMSKLNKVLVVAMLKNDTYRHTAEDEMVSLLNGKGVASYNYLTKDIKESQEPAMREKLKSEGFDGIITMKLADVSKDVNYVPGNFSTYPGFYGRFWPYYWASWNSFYEPGYYETTKTFTVVVNVYSLTRDKLVWSGVTRSVNPENVDKLMNASAKEVYKKMKEEGFIVNA